MPLAQTSAFVSLRTLLVLGRVSNLPTIWSNCFAGWILSGGGDLARFLWLSLGASYLYVGGMYLNDAFDAQFDQQHRRGRPIPSGQIRLETVWKWGLGWLGLGLLCLGFLGKTTAMLAVMLALTIFIYDAIHKIFAFSPVFVAGCRLLLVLMASSVAEQGVTGLSIWSAVALASYVLGFSYLARTESIKTTAQYWPCWFLAAPIVLALVVNDGALVVNDGEFQLRAVLLCGVVLLWTLNGLRHAFWSPQPFIGRSVASLLAGIVLVDWLAVGGGSGPEAVVFVGLFALALLFQQYIPAT
jgi:hypothetical protein